MSATDAAAKTPTVEELMQQLEQEKKRTASLERQNADLKKRMGAQQSQIEAEEELIANKLMYDPLQILCRAHS
eukprot:3375366-Rhodomonas_salina.1